MRTLLSTVTPVYRGEDSIVELVKLLATLKRELDSVGCPVELVESIFVIDDAKDQSTVILEKLRESNDWIRIIQLSNNFGQHPATMAGILYSVGDWIVTLDEDLQHHPKHILAFLRDAVETGQDIIYAKSTSSIHSFARDTASRATKFIASIVSGNRNIRRFNSFRLIRGDIARAAAGLASSYTFFDVALGWFTSRIGTHTTCFSDPRKISDSRKGYSLSRLTNHGFRLIATSEIRALRTGAILGVIAVATAIVFSVRALLNNIISPQLIEIKGWSSLFLSILFFGGLIALMTGIALEYLGNLYAQSQGKPTFFVVDRRNDKNLIEWFKENPHELHF